MSSLQPAAQPGKISIMETTLRDGEQAPYVNFFPPEKLEIARALAEILTEDDCLDIGFPVTSRSEFESIVTVAREIRHVPLLCLARMVEKDIDTAYDALRNSPMRRIALIVPTSDAHREFKLGIDGPTLKQLALRSVRYAQRYFDYVETGFEDATRTEPEFLLDLAEALIDAGVTCICLPDTVGCATPAEYGALVRAVKTQLPNINNLRYLAAHCHNDLGLALANSLEALRNGANMVGASFNGLGERAGNASTEELLMVFALKRSLFANANADRYGYARIAACSALVEEYSGIALQAHKPVVGANCFRHESGIHQDGLLKRESLYQILDPALIGSDPERIVIGKYSGLNGLRHKLGRLGLQLENEQLGRVLSDLKAILSSQKRVDDDCIRQVACRHGARADCA